MPSDQEVEALAAYLENPPTGGMYHWGGAHPMAQAKIAAKMLRTLSAASTIPQKEREAVRYIIDHDGFIGTAIGHYERLDGKRGVVLQQDGTNVVHVYGEKWLKPAPPAPLVIGEGMVSHVFDVAADYILEQYGIGALHHPVDRARIRAALQPQHSKGGDKPSARHRLRNEG